MLGFILDWWPLIVAAIVAYLGVLYYRFNKICATFDKHGIPYIRPYPVIGSAWKAVFQLVTFADAVKEIYDTNSEAKYVGMIDFMTPLFMIRDLDLIKTITVKHFEHFTDHRSVVSDNAEPLFSKNLFALRGDRWKEVRNIMSPAFTSSKMKSMFVLMRECAKEYGDYFASLKPEESTLELKDAFTRYTNDVIATCAFGIKVNSMKDKDNKFYVYGRQSTSFGRFQSFMFFLIRSAPKLSALLGLRIFRKTISDFFKDLVADTIKTRDEKGIVRPDMIQLMMETRGKLGPGKELTIEDMTAQAFVFFFGGFESTSTLMCFAAYEVGVNQDVQTALQEEIDQVLEDCNGEVTYEALCNMKLLDAIVYESLRMYPVIVAVDREVVKPYELPPSLPGGKPLKLQKGDYLWLPIYGIQYDPQHFPEPEKFKPERFFDDSTKQLLNSGAFLAFGMGPRMCIGNRFALLEAKVLLFHIFAKCSLVPCKKTTIPMKLSKKGFQMTAENGFWFDIVPRKKNESAEKVMVLEAPIISG